MFLRLTVIARVALALHLSNEAQFPASLEVVSDSSAAKETVDPANCMWSSWSACYVDGPPYRCGRSKQLQVSTSRSASSCGYNAGKVEWEGCGSAECPRWVAGEWSDCSSVCGSNNSSAGKPAPPPFLGVQNRIVSCMQGNIAFTDDVCDTLVGSLSRPIEQQPCDCGFAKAPADPIFGSLLVKDANTGVSSLVGISSKSNKYVWVTSSWGPCGALCGVGVQLRTVTCVDSDLSEQVGDANCDSSTEPDYSRNCQGSCLNCSASAGFFQSIGFTNTISDPVIISQSVVNLTSIVYDESGVCGLSATSSSCCSSDLNTQLRLSFLRMNHSLTEEALIRDRLRDHLEFSSFELADKLGKQLTLVSEETNQVQEAMMTFDSSSSRWTSLSQLNKLLSTRLDDLSQASSDLSGAMESFQTQLDAFSYSPELDLIDFASSSSFSGSSGSSGSFLEISPSLSIPLLSPQCQQAIYNITGGLMCDACNPSFSLSRLSSSGGVVVSFSKCTAAYEACKDSLVGGHDALENALSLVKSVHSRLVSLAATAQPIFSGVWADLKLPWLPTLPGTSGSVTVPDLTELTCLTPDVLSSYDIPNFNSDQTAFCENYFTDISAGAVVGRIDTVLKAGYGSLKVLESCDSCVQAAIDFMTQALSAGKGTLGVSLTGYANEVITKCQATVTTTKSSMTSLFALKRSTEQSNSFNATLVFDNVVADEYPELAVPAWSALTDTTNPPLEWKLAQTAGDTDGLQISILNVPCTSHSVCQSQAGGAWWFCASLSACSLGGCSEESASVLSGSENGGMCASGVCLNGALQAIDGKCPDSAVCPSSGTGGSGRPSDFNQEYFAKFVPLSTTEKSACDCAFGENGEIIDSCAHARCVGYAQTLETRQTCLSGLKRVCELEISSCPRELGFDCSDLQAIKLAPPETGAQCTLPAGGTLPQKTAGGYVRWERKVGFWFKRLWNKGKWYIIGSSIALSIIIVVAVALYLRRSHQDVEGIHEPFFQPVLRQVTSNQ